MNNELNNLRNQWMMLATGEHAETCKKAWRAVDVPDIEDENLCEIKYVQSLIIVARQLIISDEVTA
tara:strand:- start:239 stop:436 length:198 start_codon:yes stop_codon:yes gene_type:complete